MQALRAKTKIKVEKGRSLYGVLDEEGVIEYGQVLIQYEKDSGILEHVIGPVIVTKTPCLHPGDLLVLEVSGRDTQRLHPYQTCEIPAHPEILTKPKSVGTDFGWHDMGRWCQFSTWGQLPFVQQLPSTGLCQYWFVSILVRVDTLKGPCIAKHCTTIYWQ